MSHKTIHKLKTPRIKSLSLHPTRPLLALALYDGTFHLLSTQTNELIQSTKVSDLPLRTSTYFIDTLLLGCDDGRIYLYTTSLSSFPAHKDFIRKITVHNNFILSCSDDCTIKQWSLVDNTLVLRNTFDSHKHFVMDVSFISDKKFISASLDATLKVWHLDSKRELATLSSHTDGINSASLLNNYLVSCSDDLTTKIWDNYKCIYTIRGHTKNINKVKVFDNFFCTCSEDGYMKIYNAKTWKLEVSLNIGMERVWDVEKYKDRLFIACDEGLTVMQYGKESFNIVMNKDKIYYNINENLMVSKLGDVITEKKISYLEYLPTFLKVSENGKMLCLGEERNFFVNSVLGFRNKKKGVCDEMFFVDEGFLIRNENEVIYCEDDKETILCNIKKISDKNVTLLGGKSKDVYVISDEECTYLMKKNEIIVKINKPFKNVQFNNEYVILFGDSVSIYNCDYDLAFDFIDQGIDCTELDDHYKVIYEKQVKIENFFINNNILYFSSSNKLYYLFLDTENITDYSMLTFEGTFIGIYQNKAYFYSNKITQKELNSAFMNWQRNVLNNNITEVKENFREKAVSFLSLLGMTEEALNLCTDNNTKFEMLINLKRFDEALKLANNNFKYKSLMKEFMKIGDYEKAGDCAFKARNFDDLFVLNVLADNKFEREMLMCDKKNLEFFVEFGRGDYSVCAGLLEDTVFGDVFRENYVD